MLDVTVSRLDRYGELEAAVSPVAVAQHAARFATPFTNVPFALF
jgi:hypothetical protein